MWSVQQVAVILFLLYDGLISERLRLYDIEGRHSAHTELFCFFSIHSLSSNAVPTNIFVSYVG